MEPKVVVVCQEGGHEVAIEYARLLTAEGHSVMVNFPSTDGFPQAEQPSQLINERTSAVILIVSEDIFPASGTRSGFKIDTEIIHDLLSMTKGSAKPRIVPVLVNQHVEKFLKNHWLGSLQYIQDSAVDREKVVHRVGVLAGTSDFGPDISAFDDVETVIAAIEPGQTIELVAEESVPSDRVSYEIFRCTHKVKNEQSHFVHLHKRISIRKTAEHIEQHHPEVYSDNRKTALLAIEPGQTRIDDRLQHVAESLKCQTSLYLEQIISTIIESEFEELQETIEGTVNRDFLEPEVKRGVGDQTVEYPYQFSDIVSWLGSSRSGVLVLLGAGGVGKTWALLNLKQRIISGQIKFEKSIKRTVVFITSTDVNKGVASAHLGQRSITLYDLYVAYHIAVFGESQRNTALSRDTFYDAIELGNLLVVIDGLDEIISRNRSQFSTEHFFGDLSDRMTGGSDGKVLISCRNIFFDFDQARIDFPYVETWELLPFSRARTEEYFSDQLSQMPKRLEFALNLSDQIAKRPNGRYVPFVLSLIRKIALDEANGTEPEVGLLFQSSFLDQHTHFDRIIGQFCNREIDKAADPTIQLTVDQQIKVFCRIARLQESGQGFMNHTSIETVLSKILDRRDVKPVATHLTTHPFVSQELLEKRGIVSFSFDFMPEFFLMIDALLRFQSDNKIEADDIRIFNKFCTANGSFAYEIVRRWPFHQLDFRVRLLQYHEEARQIIFEEFPNDDQDILSPESATAQFSFSLVQLLAIQSSDTQDFSSALDEIFEEGEVIKRMAILDGFVRGDQRMKIDFRDRKFEDCLFHSLDFWNCRFNENTLFRRCRFMRCAGSFARDSGVDGVVWEDCQFDAEFEETFERGKEKVESSELKKLQAVKSLISDFYRAGGFRPISKENVQRYYGQSNSSVAFSKLYKVMVSEGLLSEADKGHYIEVRVSRDNMDACERLLTQGDPEKVILDVCDAI